MENNNIFNTSFVLSFSKCSVCFGCFSIFGVVHVKNFLEQLRDNLLVKLDLNSVVHFRSVRQKFNNNIWITCKNIFKSINFCHKNIMYFRLCS